MEQLIESDNNLKSLIEDASIWRLIKIIKSLLDSIHTANWAASSNVLLLMFLPQDQNKSKIFDRIRSMPWKHLNHFIVGCQRTLSVL